MERAPAPIFRRLAGVVAGWPRLSLAAGVGILVGLVSTQFDLRTTTSILIGWDAGVLFFLAALVQLMATASGDDIRRNAARQDVGQGVVLALSAVAALASVVAIYAEVTRGEGDVIAPWRLGLGIATIVLSWSFVHAMFAMHYAHQYFGDWPAGLVFPGAAGEPDYADFFYVAFVVGMTAQTPDVTITTRSVRRTVLVHALVSFWFNAAVLALLINIAADVMRG